MASTKMVFFLRHGESEANHTSGGRDIRDPALTELGCLQAASWASETPSWGVERIFVSPLMRTLQTALLAFPGTVRLHVKRSLREHAWHEDQNKGSPVDVLKTRLESCDLNLRRVRGLGKLASPNNFWDPVGEERLSREELHDRRKAATRFLERELLKRSEGVLALVCHYNTIKHFVGIGLHNCEVVVAEFHRKRRRWDMISLCSLDMPSLPRALLPATIPGVPSDFAPEEADSETLDGVAFNSDDEASTVAAQQSSGCEDEADEDEPTITPDVLAAAGTPAVIKELYESRRFKHASVLVLGKSMQFNKAVALLGGGAGHDCYRYCDFGGGLDGGPARFGGRAYKVAERQYPHLGAFRELAEEFLGLHGDEARSCANKIWQASSDRLVGGFPVQHGFSHLLFLIPAEAILDVIGTGTGKSKGKGKGKSKANDLGPDMSEGLAGIDALAERFVPNGEVSDVQMFSIDDLLACVEPDVETARLLAPIWTSSRDGGRRRVYPKCDQILIEAAFQAGDDSGVSVLGGKAVLHPVSMSHVPVRWSREVRCVERLDTARMRNALLGPRGSLASCAALLRSFSSELGDSDMQL